MLVMFRVHLSVREYLAPGNSVLLLMGFPCAPAESNEEKEKRSACFVQVNSRELYRLLRKERLHNLEQINSGIQPAGLAFWWLLC